MRLPLTLALLALALPAQAIAQAEDPQPAPTTEAAKKEKPKKICRTEDKTGSRVGLKKTCRTSEEWSEIERANQDKINRDLPNK